MASNRGKKLWSYDQDGGGRAWHGRFQLRRLELGFHVYRHEYPSSTDRWVFQPFAIYDRKG